MTTIGSDGMRRERVGAGIAAIAIHVGLGLLLAATIVRPTALEERDAIELFDVAPDSAPAPLVPRRAAPRAPGAAATPGRKAEPAPIAAPPPVVPLPLLVIAAPIAGDGAASSAGAADRGGGTGAGGSGIGLGSGGDGTGSGRGGGVRAKLLRGAIRDRDYPPAARKAGAMGDVTVAFTVDPRGRPGGCAIAVSSGNAALDAATCRLIEARFRYAPARDADGAAVAEPRGWRQRWWFAGKRKTAFRTAVSGSP